MSDQIRRTVLDDGEAWWTLTELASEWERRHPDPFATVAKPQPSTYLDACESAIASAWAVRQRVVAEELSPYSTEAKAALDFVQGARAGAAVIVSALGYEVEQDKINKLLGLE